MNSRIVSRVIDLAVQIQQIPAPTFAEEARGEFVRKYFAKENLSDIAVDSIGNVMSRVPGTGSQAPIVVSAHLDTVFPIETDLSVQISPDKIAGPGIGDNSVGLAGLMGLLWEIQEGGKELASDIWLVANVGEEGLGDLRGIKEIVNHFYPAIQEIKIP